MNMTPGFPYRVVGKDAASQSTSSLGASKELQLFSLAEDGLDCIAGVGRSQINFSRVNFPEHIHPRCFEVHYCLRGQLTFAADGREYRCMPSDVFLTQPDVPHRLVERKRGQRHYWLLFKFPKRRVESIPGLDEKESALMCRRLAAIRKRQFRGDERLKTLFRNLFAICESEPSGGLRSIKLKATTLMILLVILDCAERTDRATGTVNKRMQDVIDEIRRNPAKAMSTEELAQKAALSESRFSVLFKKATGLPPHSFIVSCRMEEVKRLLRETGKPISAIADEMGFASPRHLAAQFQQFFGMAPRDFRGTSA